ncbi:site-specific DNA-methyltransferase [Micromonospora sp. BRA006-A]|uniref:hypothetical protein n=1 Tax=Micromonospora sp. BRA006-A TaxID=2962860 RepID=UPI00296F1868|nr:hypothetical protein [Micromonospora sp. BRA006-A]MDW3845257.1 site-specific DNA-methyltransferase [Micromonospora sp. BRA006-A]
MAQQDRKVGSWVAANPQSVAAPSWDATNGTLFPERPEHRSPKRPRVEMVGLADIFPYYAGFSFDWARGLLPSLATSSEPRVLDPWNGSGTTTLAAQALGYKSVGVDLNPIANVIARLRTQVQSSAEAIPPPKGPLAAASADDPLSAWFTHPTVERLRSWTSELTLASRASATLGQVALFRVVKSLTSKFQGSNPTWVRRAASPDELVDVPADELDSLIVADQHHILSRLRTLPRDKEKESVALVTASSSALPIKDGSIDVILTSPPYLTRIDYAVAYARELAVLGVDIRMDRRLRAGLMGTTLIRPSDEQLSYGPLATDLVDRIKSHSSKASNGYYRKQAIQYLNDLVGSLDEIQRVAAPRASAVLVVQDSYYKDVHVRLAEICEEEMSARGWTCKPRRFRVDRILTSVNTAARAYTKGDVYETVLTFTRGKDD